MQSVPTAQKMISPATEPSSHLPLFAAQHVSVHGAGGSGGGGDGCGAFGGNANCAIEGESRQPTSHDVLSEPKPLSISARQAA